MASSEPTTANPAPSTALMTVNNPASFYAAAQVQRVCAVCKKVTRNWEAHHVVQKQRCRVEGAPLHSPDDALRLCAREPGACHERHTSGIDRVPLSCLRDENIAFAHAALGAGPAYVYLIAQYAGTDPRVDRLLEKW
jgi:hypothetical protein